MNHEKVQRRKQHRPQELIEAGLQEFALNGFAATRMVDIATRAKVSKGTIYVYYKSKESPGKDTYKTQKDAEDALPALYEDIRKIYG